MMEFTSLHYCIPFIGVCAFVLAIHVKGQWSKTLTMESGDDYVASEGGNTKQNIDGRSNSHRKNDTGDSIGPNQCTKLNSDSEKRVRRKSSIGEDVGGWKCACEGGNGIFLPQSLMKSFSGPGAAMRLGAGGCYHKQM
jgi:hypothetical protein